MTTIGALYLKEGNSQQAMDYFNSAVKQDQTFSNALLGIASIHQDQCEYESALIKYKLSFKTNPNSPLIWNNLGLCFFAKKKFIAAATCLKKAHYLDPFQWIVCFNLGLVYLHTNQYASAFHYMNAAANLKPDLGVIYMYVGIILSQLGDISNAIVYYDKAIDMGPNYLLYLNYTISLLNNDMNANARDKFQTFLELYSESQNENNTNDDEEEIKSMVGLIKAELKKSY